MTEQHPITPSPELLRIWFEQYHDYGRGVNELLIEAARYGADRELKECAEWISKHCATWTNGKRPEDELRNARRPKPPSLKQQALDQLSHVEDRYGVINTDYIRRALETLPDD